MALKSANQPIRWLQRIGTWITLTISVICDVLKAFFNFKKGDGLLTKSGKTADTAVRQATYIGLDYGLWFVSVGIFTTLKLLEFPFLCIFSALWVYDFVVAGTFVVFYEKTGKDLSLGEDFRRAMDMIHKKSRFAGYVVMIPIVIRGIFWTGPEKIITFFRKEIGTVVRITIALLVLTAIQALVWTTLYGLGYGLVVSS